MPQSFDFDPMNVSGALAMLASELHEELTSGEPAEAMFLLRLELARVVVGARRWAERHAIPAACVPDPPGVSADAQECLEALHRLAAVLRYLGSQTAPSGSMRELVAWLRLRDAGALREVAELEQVLEWVARALMGVEAAARTLSDDLELPASRLNGKASATATARARAMALHDAAKVVLDAFRELQDGLRAWGAAEQA